MDSTKTADQLTIVNRSTEHRISKQLIRKIPYFEKMLSHDLKESKENKVILDFDEKALKAILKWLELGYIFIGMDYVINICNILDYFGVNNHLINDCTNHFDANFSIDDIPVVIPQVTAKSKLINSGTLNAFICRYFTKIANAAVWLDYPVKTIEYICALDLMIYSEYQVFDAILKWVNFKADFRKCYLKGLLKLIRWCHSKDTDLSKMKENELFKSSDFEPELCSLGERNCDCKLDRTKQNCFIAIEQLNGTALRVKVLESNLMPLVSIVVQSDESIPSHLFHNEHVSDIFCDSGRKLLRIDWKQAKYRRLGYGSHFCKMRKCLFKDRQSEHRMDLMLQNYKGYDSSSGALLEANDKFVLVRYHDWFNRWATPTPEVIKCHFVEDEHKYVATVLDNKIYIIKDTLMIAQVNVDGNLEYKEIRIERLRDFKFDNLILTSNLAYDDKVFIIDKSTKAVYCYYVETQRWGSMGQIIDCDSKYAGQRQSDKLITFAPAFIPMDTIASELDQRK